MSNDWWESLIVAAANTTDCRFLLTEDLQDRQTLGELTVIDPFQSTLAELPIE
jgi:predicted nucleic acid-binding protein